MQVFTKTLNTIIGPLTLVANTTHLIALFFGNKADFNLLQKQRQETLSETQEHSLLLEKASHALEEYFHNGNFSALESVPVAPKGTPFQMSVWNSLREIPCGETRSYGEIAQQIGNPKAVRAVGLANGKNPLPLFFPCHRVIGANGSLTGFGGGLPLKSKLLALEQKGLFV